MGFILLRFLLSQPFLKNTNNTGLYQTPSRADHFRYWARTGLVLMFFFFLLLLPLGLCWIQNALLWSCYQLLCTLTSLGLQKPKGHLDVTKYPLWDEWGICRRLSHSAPVSLILPVSPSLWPQLWCVPGAETGRRPWNCRFRFWWSSVISFLQPETGGMTATRRRGQSLAPFAFCPKGRETWRERKSQRGAPPPVLWCEPPLPPQDQSCHQLKPRGSQPWKRPPQTQNNKTQLNQWWK